LLPRGYSDKAFLESVRAETQAGPLCGPSASAEFAEPLSSLVYKTPCCCLVALAES